MNKMKKDYLKPSMNVVILDAKEFVMQRESTTGESKDGSFSFDDSSFDKNSSTTNTWSED